MYPICHLFEVFFGSVNQLKFGWLAGWITGVSYHVVSIRIPSLAHSQSRANWHAYARKRAKVDEGKTKEIFEDLNKLFQGAQDFSQDWR